ncbi:hypothetical protein DFH07DRAFT_1067512 [Mycena maculata]|uniref:Uncharacterized protein n=1 Tax=Mycena maculata TaxID=230809 RepID=A0AAD7MKN0_9AGAR|nr:hypothetical protein DFH07DRAFT_1067512 [Mycena maculata]
MHPTSSSVPTVEHTAETTAATVGTESTPVNHNGPQCSCCGWRGGNHASNCAFNPANYTNLQLIIFLISPYHPKIAFLNPVMSILYFCFHWLLDALSP